MNFCPRFEGATANLICNSPELLFAPVRLSASSVFLECPEGLIEATNEVLVDNLMIDANSANIRDFKVVLRSALLHPD